MAMSTDPNPEGKDYCRDDFTAPGDTPFLCTLRHGHEGDHEAWGGLISEPYETWVRGEGRYV